MPSFPPVLLALLMAASAAIPTVLLLITIASPFLRRWLENNVAVADRQKLFAATQGAYVIVAAIAKRTPGFKLDDGIAEVLQLVSHEIRATLGRELSEGERTVVRHMATSMHADPRLPGDIGAGDLVPAIVTPVPTSTTPRA